MNTQNPDTNTFTFSESTSTTVDDAKERRIQVIKYLEKMSPQMSEEGWSKFRSDYDSIRTQTNRMNTDQNESMETMPTLDRLPEHLREKVATWGNRNLIPHGAEHVVSFDMRDLKAVPSGEWQLAASICRALTRKLFQQGVAKVIHFDCTVDAGMNPDGHIGQILIADIPLGHPVKPEWLNV